MTRLLENNNQQNDFVVSGKTKVGWGKHRGKTHQELLDEDLDYCGWVVSQNQDDFKYKQTRDWLLSKGVNPRMVKSKLKYDENEVITKDSVVKFGKFRGKTYNWLMKNEKGYVEWIILQNNGFRYEKSRQFLIDNFDDE